MAKKGGSKVAGGFVAGIIGTVAVLFGLNQFGIGLGGGDGLLPAMSNEVAQTQEVEESAYNFAAIIKVSENTISVDDKEVDIADLKENLGFAADKAVLVIDKGAAHGTWSEVIKVLQELNCVIEEE